MAVQATGRERWRAPETALDDGRREMERGLLAALMRAAERGLVGREAQSLHGIGLGDFADGRHAAIYQALVMRLAVQSSVTSESLLTDLVVHHGAPEGGAGWLLRALRADGRAQVHLAEDARRVREHRIAG